MEKCLWMYDQNGKVVTECGKKYSFEDAFISSAECPACKNPIQLGYNVTQKIITLFKELFTYCEDNSDKIELLYRYYEIVDNIKFRYLINIFKEVQDKEDKVKLILNNEIDDLYLLNSSEYKIGELKKLYNYYKIRKFKKNESTSQKEYTVHYLNTLLQTTLQYHSIGYDGKATYDIFDHYDSLSTVNLFNKYYAADLIEAERYKLTAAILKYNTDLKATINKSLKTKIIEDSIRTTYAFGTNVKKHDTLADAIEYVNKDTRLVNVILSFMAKPDPDSKKFKDNKQIYVFIIKKNPDIDDEGDK